MTARVLEAEVAGLASALLARAHADVGAVVLTRAGQTVIDEDALPREVRDAAATGTAGGAASALTFPIGMPLAEIEMRVIHETLRHTRGDKRLTAKLLGIATRTIYRRLEATGEGGGDPGDDESESKE